MKKYFFPFILSTALAFVILSLGACGKESCEHQAALIEPTYPTCDTAGTTAGTYCTLCDEILSSPEEIPATGHMLLITDGFGVSCTDDGLTERAVCTVCGYLVQNHEVIPATGHTYKDKICTVCGEEFAYSQGLLYSDNGDGTCYVSGIGTFDGAQLFIPDSSPIGLRVVGIEAEAFHNARKIISVTLPEGIESIGRCAFSGCTRLSSIEIPEGVKVIGSEAFSKNVSLTDISLPTSLQYISSDAFSGCESLNYNEYAGVNYLGNDENPYIALIGLKDGVGGSCVISDRCKFIFDYAFLGCTGVEFIDIPDSVISIGRAAFSGCSDVLSVKLGKNVSMIDLEAFFSCPRLVELVNNSESYTLPSAYNTANIFGTSLMITHSGDSIIKSHGDYRFITLEGINYLIGASVGTKILDLPESYSGENYVINDFAFYYLEKITAVSIPERVSGIGKQVFLGCTGLKSITVDEENPLFKSIDGSLYSKDGTILIQYATGRTDTEFTLPESVKTIGEYAFCTNTSLHKVTLTEGVKTIGANSFRACAALETVILPDSVSEIGSYAFARCKNLREITIPSGVKTIGNAVFQNCESLKSIVIGRGVKSIGYLFLDGCTSLASVRYLGSKEEWQDVLVSSSNGVLNSLLSFSDNV